MSKVSGLTQYQPLYMQVKQLFIQRLIDQTWTPGFLLPSEQLLAKELNVSQGTVRKALDEMTHEKLVVRKQGRGTFVAEHTQDKPLFHFFKLVDLQGQRQAPDSQVLSVETSVATEVEKDKLQLKQGESVVRITRARELVGTPIIWEQISLPSALFSQQISGSTLPNHLYGFYQREFAISVNKVNESLRAVAAKGDICNCLKVNEGTPILEIERVALSLDGKPVELRISSCLTESYRYYNELT